MSEYKPEAGHWVAIKARVFDVSATGENVAVELFSKTDQYRADVRRDLIIERLPDPEPEWQAGDVVMDDEREVYRRCKFKDGWWAMGTSADVEFQRPIRPLTLLVRDGKAVQP